MARYLVRDIYKTAREKDGSEANAQVWDQINANSAPTALALLGSLHQKHDVSPPFKSFHPLFPAHSHCLLHSPLRPSVLQKSEVPCSPHKEQCGREAPTP